jgi:hypothetical protein
MGSMSLDVIICGLGAEAIGFEIKITERMVMTNETITEGAAICLCSLKIIRLYRKIDDILKYSP